MKCSFKNEKSSLQIEIPFASKISLFCFALIEIFLSLNCLKTVENMKKKYQMISRN